jgi:transposase
LQRRGPSLSFQRIPPENVTIHLNANSYKQRNIIERMFARLKDFRHIPTRYDKLARNDAASVALVAIVIWWT